MPSEQNLQPADGVNSEELESLKRRLAEFEERQKEFDDLRRRVEVFESQKSDADIEKRFRAVADGADVHDGVVDIIDEKMLNEHRDNIRKVFNRQSDINLTDLQKEFLKKKIERFVNLFDLQALSIWS